MPRLASFAGVALLLVGGALLLTDALLAPPGVTEANARRIQKAMALERVEAILIRAGKEASGTAE